MSQHNMRKEPTFGEPTIAKADGENVESKSATINNGHGNKFNFSLHSSKSPGHTFTPVMKRPTAKAQSFASMEEQAEQHQVNHTSEPVKTAPAFVFAPVTDQADTTSTQNQEISKSATSEVSTKIESGTENISSTTMNSQTIERVIPTVQSEQKKVDSGKLSTKYRRLMLVGLLALTLLLVFFLLKPNTPETVEQLQSQDNSLPIEFRPVNEAEAKRAEEEAKALATQQSQTEQTNQMLNASSDHAPQAEQHPTSEASTSTVPVVPATPMSTPNIEVSKPAVEIAKPNTSGSVIYQAEAEKTQVEKIKPTTQSKPETKTEKVQLAKQNVEAVKAKPAKATSEIVSTKTLTVPKGVSLMQVFRDNNLNISDVNAMSKVNKAVSNLKVGEKVTVRLDKNSRVVEMRVKAGTYVRQANGTYSFR